MTIKRWATKKDANHKDCADAIRSAGWSVEDISGAGGGVPDLLCSRDGRFVLVEVKRDKAAAAKKTPVTKRQDEFKARHVGCPIFTVTSPQDAIEQLS